MSDKDVKSGQNKEENSILKWSLVILVVLVLEATAIVSSVKITEMQGKADASKLQNIYDKLSSQQMQMNVLEKMPTVISSINQKLNSDAQNLDALIEEFNQLKEEVGNKQVPDLVKKITEIEHSIEIIEENSRGEALVLNLALIIKENILYQRPFVQEAELLNQLSQNNEEIKLYASIIDNYKNQQIQNDYELAQEYMKLSQSFVFAKEQEKEDAKTQSTMAKGVKMLKDTMANINFDKVIVLKKDKLTKQQTDLIEKLDALIANYKYQEALEVIKEHTELKNINTEAFNLWQKKVMDKLSIEEALNNLITAQLSAFRQDIKEDKLKENMIVQKENNDIQPEISEPEEIPEAEIEEVTND